MDSSASGTRPGMRVVPGGRRLTATLAGIRIVVAHEDDEPFPVDAVVLEEDTWLVLSARPDVVSATPHPVRVITAAWEQRPEAPGSLLVKADSPLRLLAVVHDLDAEPTLRDEWVKAALAATFAEARTRHLTSLKLPLLGTRHGGLSARRFLRLLRAALADAVADALAEGDSPFPLQRIWLARTDESGAALLEELLSSDG